MISSVPVGGRLRRRIEVSLHHVVIEEITQILYLIGKHNLDKLQSVISRI